MNTQQNNESTMYGNQEKIIPMMWTKFEELEAFAVMYWDCMFTTDFGPFIAGKHYDTVFIDYLTGDIESYRDSKVEHTAKFIASII